MHLCKGKWKGEEGWEQGRIMGNISNVNAEDLIKYLKNIKYLGLTLTKQVKHLYDNMLKSLKKETVEDIRR